MKNPNKGFTLVELAVVLVIVGLLIGGILVARSLIGSAEINAMARQVGQYDAAIENFQQKFHGIPGDNSKFYASGNNNSLIEDADGTDGKGAKFAGEVANFWPSLESATQIKISAATPANLNDIMPAAGNRFTATISGKIKTVGATINIPPTKFGNPKTGVVVTNDYLAPSDPGSLTTRKLHGAYILANFEGVTANTTALAGALAGSIRPADAQALDSKLDDGLANSGGIIALPETASCNSGAGYAASNNAEVCALAVGYMRLHEAKKATGGGPDLCSPDPCNGHGSCSVGTCNCSTGYTGADCASCDSGYHDSSGSCVADGCSGSCAYGSQNLAPDCSCIDPGCSVSGGNWNNADGTCDCAAAGGCSPWSGTSCVSTCLGSQSCVSGSCADPTCDATMCMSLDGSSHSCVSLCSGAQSCSGGSCMCANQITDEPACQNSCASFDSTTCSCGAYSCVGMQTCNSGTCTDPSCDSMACQIANSGVCVSSCSGGQSCDGSGACICPGSTTWNGSACASAPVCGNGIVESGEGCDDGNTNANDGCSPTCQIEYCGDGLVNGAEECDDGGTSNADGCDSSCHIEADPCAGITCNNGGSCSSGSCNCSGGYSGPTCDTPPSDPCDGISCSNGGSCTGGSCSCTGGYSGPTCDTPPADPCDGITCNHGSCSTGACTCDGAWYSGVNGTCNDCDASAQAACINSCNSWNSSTCSCDIVGCGGQSCDGSGVCM